MEVLTYRFLRALRGGVVALLVTVFWVPISAAERLAPDFHWAKTGFPKRGLFDVALDSQGQIYVLFNLAPRTELFGKIFDSGNGQASTVIAKLSASGDFLRFIDVGVPGVGQALAVDHEGSILVGGVVGTRDPVFEVGGQSYSVSGASFREDPSPDAFVMKLDSEGDLQWFQHFGGASQGSTGELVKDIAVGPEGNVAIAGSWRGAGQFGNGVAKAGGESDGFVALLSKDGFPRWIHVIGSPDDGGNDFTVGRGEFARTIAMDSEGNVVAGGFFMGVIPIGNKTVTSRVVPRSSPPKHTRDGYVVKIARSGRVLWADAIGGDVGGGRVSDVAIGPNQEVVAAGSFRGKLALDHGGFDSHPNGGSDIFMVKYDREGDPILTLKLGADKADGSNSVSVDSQGRIYLFAMTGYLEFDDLFVLPTGSRGGAMMCFDETGHGLWAMGGLFEFFQAIPFPGTQGSQFLVHTSVQPGQAFLEGYSSDFTINQEGPGAHVLMSMDGAPWPDEEPAPENYHPADLNSDWRLDINEVTGYGRAWKTGALWENEPNPVPINYVTRAGAIWKNGEHYAWDETVGEAPNAWVNQ